MSYDGNQKYLDDDKIIVNFERMKLASSNVLRLHTLDPTSYINELESIELLKQLLTNVSK